MGKQVGFYAVGDDYSDILRHAEAIGLKAIPETIAAESDVAAVSPAAYRPPPGQEVFYLIPEEFGVGEAIYVEIDGAANVDRLNASGSPVIELAPCPQREDWVFNGRIYLGIESGDGFYPATLKYFNKLARYVRAWAKTDRFGFVVGPRTAERARRSEIRLMHHQIEIHVA